MDIVYYVKRGNEYLMSDAMPGDAERWTDDFMVAREFYSEELAQKVADSIAGARVMAMD